MELDCNWILQREGISKVMNKIEKNLKESNRSTSEKIGDFGPNVNLVQLLKLRLSKLGSIC